MGQLHSSGAERAELFVIATAQPAHDQIVESLHSLFAARRCLEETTSLSARIVLVCDSCPMRMAEVAEEVLLTGRDFVIECRAHDAQTARRLGACLARSAMTEEGDAALRRQWYAFTDAGTCVAVDWLQRHWNCMRSEVPSTWGSALYPADAAGWQHHAGLDISADRVAGCRADVYWHPDLRHLQPHIQPLQPHATTQVKSRVKTRAKTRATTQAH